MRMKNNGGFSLMEVLVAIVLLAALVIPTCTGLTLSLRMNARSQELMHAQLTVSSAVESMMATGITEDFCDSLEIAGAEYAQLAANYPEKVLKVSASYPKILLIVEPEAENGRYFDVTVISKDGLVAVETSIRAKQEGSP